MRRSIGGSYGDEGIMQRSKHFRDKEWKEERKDTQVDWMDG